MKAIVRQTYRSPEGLELEETNQPVPGDGDVLVRVHAAGLDQGVWHLVTGRPYLLRIVGFGLRRPGTPLVGRDVAGRVEAVGRGVSRFRPGDEVFGTCAGAFAEYACGPQGMFAPKPANITFEQAAAVPTSGFAALQGLRRSAQVREGDKVLVIGAGGGVGTFAVQLAKEFGATVTGVCSTKKVDLVRSIGADDVIDYTREDFADSPHRYDLILDTAGGRALSDLRRALAPRGSLVIVGSEEGGRWTQGVGRAVRAALLSPFIRQNLRMLVSTERADDLELLGQLLGAGTLKPVVDRTYSLSETAEAIAYMRSRQVCGKVVITP